MVKNTIANNTMNIQYTLDQLKSLNLDGMHAVYQSLINTPVNELPGVHSFMARIVESEMLDRSNKKMQKNMSNSKMRYNAVLQQIECNAQRNITREQLDILSDCSFIKRGQNILITGAAGCGKSYLACAIGRQACMFGYKVAYTGILRFVETMTQGKVDGSYMRQINKLNKADLIILDDFGLTPLSQHTRAALLQILEDRYSIKSTIVTSQYPVAEWHALIEESTMADAILDRLTADAHKLELKGESMRRKSKKF